MAKLLPGQKQQLSRHVPPSAKMGTHGSAQTFEQDVPLQFSGALQHRTSWRSTLAL